MRQRNKYRPNAIAEIHSVAVAITNCILFPFYKSQFRFYVFVSSLGVSMCAVRLSSPISRLVLFFPVRLLFDPNRIEGSVHSSQSTHDPRSCNISLRYLLMFSLSSIWYEPTTTQTSHTRKREIEKSEKHTL